MLPLIKQAFLTGETQFPAKQPLTIIIDDEKLKGKSIKGEWGVTLTLATDSRQDFSQTFKEITGFIKNLEIYYSINGRILPYVDLFNTIIMDARGVSYPISSRETVVPIYQKIDQPVKFSVAFIQKDDKIKLPAHSNCLLYMALRCSVIADSW